MPVMVAAALEMRAGGGSGSSSEQRGNSRRTAVRTAGAAGAVRGDFFRAASKQQLERKDEIGSEAARPSYEKCKQLLIRLYTSIHRFELIIVNYIYIILHLKSTTIFHIIY